MGACFGFLWWNTSPAKIFMGDTGSLALGGALAGLAICSRTELLLALLGGLFVLITMSVVIQVGSFRLTGKRVFRMAPLQHHFELKGWTEVLIVVRFWIIQGMCVTVGLGLFYAGWAARSDDRARLAEHERVTVAGLGVTGISAARALPGLGASVTVVDGGAAQAHASGRGRTRGARHRGTPRRRRDAPRGHRPRRHLAGLEADSPLFAAAAEAGVDVVGRRGARLAAARPRTPRPGSPSPAPTARPPPPGCSPSILAAAGLRTAAVGNIGTPDRRRGTAKATTRTTCSPSSCPATSCTGRPRCAPHSAAVLNIAPDHLDWHGSMEAYAADKGRIYEGNQVACVYNTRRQPRPRAWCARPTSRRAAGRSASPSAPRPLPTRRGGRHPGRPRLRRRPARARPGARRGRGRPPARPAQHRQRPGRGRARPRLRGRARRRTRRPARLPPDAHRIAEVAERRRRHLRRRLQGHQHARGGGLAGRRTSRSCGSPAASPRARTSTSSSPRRRRGCAGSCCSAPTGR